MIQNGGIHQIELILLLLLLFVVVFAALARKLQTPYPIVLVIAGLLLSFVPGIPKVSLNPDVVFLVVLPPLLYAAAWVTSWREFKFNLVSIFMLAFGLVGFTVAGVAAATTWVFAGFDWRLGFVLGAVVATTDAIAATSIAKRIGLPQRIVDILEGESLVNDATGLLALEFAVAILVSGQRLTVGAGLMRLAYLTIAGLALGLLVGFIVARIHKLIDDGPIEITLTLLVPYMAYLAADAIHASGVLAVVACGLYVSRQSSQFFSPSVRMQAQAVLGCADFRTKRARICSDRPAVTFHTRWNSGLQLQATPAVWRAFSAIVIVLRLIWMFPGAYLATVIRRRLLHQDVQFPSTRQIFVVGWRMRGVVALAAAIALPKSLADGSPFPQRNLIVFLTFSVILVTLVLQGLTLPPLIRALGLAGPKGRESEEDEARKAMVEAALAHLENARKKEGDEFGGVYEDFEARYKHRLAKLTGTADAEIGANPAVYARYVEFARELLRAERETAMKLRDQGRINDEVLRRVEHELDLSEERLSLM
jgi:CPA1 family monovalent cation:H+ antiporter